MNVYHAEDGSVCVTLNPRQAELVAGLLAVCSTSLLEQYGWPPGTIPDARAISPLWFEAASLLVQPLPGRGYVTVHAIEAQQGV